MFRRLRHAALSVALVAAFPLPSPAQEPVDAAAIERIRQEAFERSRVMELAQQLTGFELLKPEGDIPETKLVTPEALQIIRTQVDPRGVFTQMPAA